MSVADQNNIYLESGTNNMWPKVIFVMELAGSLLYLTHNLRKGFCSPPCIYIK